MLPDQ